MRCSRGRILLWVEFSLLLLANQTEAALVARWDLDEGAGVMLNPRVGSIQGTLTDASWQMGGPPTTYVEQASSASHHLLFGGETTDKVAFSHWETLNPGCIHVGFWAKATGDHAKNILLSKWNTASSSDSSWEFGFSGPRGETNAGYLFFRTLTSNSPSPGVFAGLNTATPFTTSDFNDGQWHRIEGVHDGTASTLFVDGNPVETVSNPGMLCNSSGQTTMLLGQRPHASAREPYNGLIGGPITLADLTPEGGVSHRWDLDEAEGMFLYPSMGTIDGQLEGNVTWQPDGPPDIATPTHVLDFSSSSEACVNLGNAGELNPENLTVAFWAKATGDHAKSILMSKWNTALTTDSSWEFGFTKTLDPESGGNLFFRTQTDSGQVFVGRDVADPFTTSDFNDGQWHFFAGTHDGSHSCLYVDGRLIESLAQEGGISDSGGVTDLLLGRRPHASAQEPYGGLLGGPLLLYDQALEANALRTLCGASEEPLSGDLDGDGFVGGNDLDCVRANWGQYVVPGDEASGDPSGDGFVGGDDLDCIRTHWGEGEPPGSTNSPAVPEPGGLAMLAMLGVLAPVRGWRKRVPS